MKRLSIFVILACVITGCVCAQQTQKVEIGNVEFQVPSEWTAQSNFDGILTFAICFDNQTDPNQVYFVYNMPAGSNLEYVKEYVMKNTTQKLLGTDSELGTYQNCKVGKYDALKQEVKSSKVVGTSLKGYIYAIQSETTTVLLYCLHTPTANDMSQTIVNSVKINASTLAGKSAKEQLDEWMRTLRPHLPQKIEDGVLLVDFNLLDDGEILYVMGLESIRQEDMDSSSIEMLRSMMTEGASEAIKQIMNGVPVIKQYVGEGHGVYLRVVDANKKEISSTHVTSNELRK